MPAESKIARYDAPLTYTDGSPIDVKDIVGYEIGWGVKPRAETGDTYPNLVSDTTFETGRQSTDMGPIPVGGPYYGAARAKVVGASSAWGPEGTFSVSAKVPEPPRNFSIGS